MTTESRRAAFEAAIPSILYSDWFGKGDTRDDILEVVNDNGLPEKVYLDGCMASLVYPDAVITVGYDGNEYVHTFAASKCVYNAALDSVAAPVPQQEVVGLIEAARNVLELYTFDNADGTKCYAGPESIIVGLRDALSALPQQRVWTRDEIAKIINDNTHAYYDYSEAYQAADALIAANVVKVG